MATHVMFGTYSSDALKKVSSSRTVKADELIRKFGGKVVSMYALFGEKDLMFITEFPTLEHAMKASVGLTKLTGISLSTYPAVSVEEFDKLVEDI
ncbi:MAG: GYD domain-containing protein [Desulfomonilia bacterium]|nr:GYD domain-containing protein [Desulfomonilia bacterium]